jgi:hypothetical protein
MYSNVPRLEVVDMILNAVKNIGISEDLKLEFANIT